MGWLLTGKEKLGVYLLFFNILLRGLGLPDSLVDRDGWRWRTVS